MKKNMVTAFMTLCMAVCVAGLVGCGHQESAEKEPGMNAVCYAIAPTANSQGLNMNSPLVQDTIYDTILDYGYVSVVVIDGDPEMAAADSYDIPAQYKNGMHQRRS